MDNLKPPITRLSPLLLMLYFLSCTGSTSPPSISYPMPYPDSVALLFLPDLVSNTTKDSLDFNAAFSPNGHSFYFTRPVNGKWQIFSSSYTGVRWTKPELADFNEPNYSQADPAFGPDNNLYFISNRPRNNHLTIADFNIWLIKPQADGQWSSPEYVDAVNTDSTEYYISFAQTGNLYFSSARAGGFGQEDIYVSRGSMEPTLNRKTWALPLIRLHRIMIPASQKMNAFWYILPTDRGMDTDRPIYMDQR